MYSHILSFLLLLLIYMSDLEVFENIIMIVFQIIFYLEMHQNNIYLFIKLIFYINVSK